MFLETLRWDKRFRENRFAGNIRFSKHPRESTSRRLEYLKSDTFVVRGKIEIQDCRMSQPLASMRCISKLISRDVKCARTNQPESHSLRDALFSQTDGRVIPLSGRVSSREEGF
jgi:hypothetical protein